jgi:hypothetical protein
VLGKPVTKQNKALEKSMGRARHSATKESTPYTSGWFKKILKLVGLSSY